VTDLKTIEASARAATPVEQFIRDIAESDWQEIDLQHLAVNVRHSRGSLPLELKRDAASSALTLKAILAKARALQSTEAGGMSGPAEDWGDEHAPCENCDEEHPVGVLDGGWCPRCCDLASDDEADRAFDGDNWFHDPNMEDL